MGQVLLQVKDLYVTYQAGGEVVRAVNGFDFTLEEGESLGLVGETGAGKTTVALSIMGLLPERTGRVARGSIEFLGENLLQMKKKELRAIRGDQISMIFQDPMTSLNPVLSVGEQILEGLELHNKEQKTKKELEQRACEMLELVGIPAERYSEFPHQFSGGMKQRVVIAMALACNPKLLIADEPTTALDVTIQAQVLDMMSALREQMNMTMILITHDLGIVAEQCDKVATVYAGQIIEYGRVEDIFEGKRHHPYTQGLFDALPSLVGEERRLKSIHGLMPDPTHLPTGCKFHPRCPHCTQRCREVEPPAVQLGETHMVRCHLFAETGEEGTAT